MSRGRIAQVLVGALLLHLLWSLVAYYVNAPLLPQPWRVYAHLYAGDMGQSLSQHMGASLGRILWGMSLSLLVALSLSLLGYKYRSFGRVLDAFTYLSYPIPKLALLPVVMLLAGLGELAKVLMIMLIILFQLIVSLRDALRALPADSIAVMRAMGAGVVDKLLHLLLPALIPSIGSALRVALGTAISVLFVTETYGTTLGMGYYIVDAWMRLDYLDMYAGIVLLGGVGFALFILLDLVEAWLCPYRETLIDK